MDITKSSPVVEVDTGNIEDVWPELQKSMLECSFIALDSEMSGLGSENTFQKNAEDRYRVLKTAAQSRSLISLGITCFKLVMEDSVPTVKTDSDGSIMSSVVYKATPYNILLLCSDSFTIDPSAVSFLTQHGFDFNKQFAKGLKYKKGCHNPNSKPSESHSKKIFEELIRVRKPIIVHNGFCDLVYLYECFYAPCPSKLSVFMSDLTEMFPSGIYDTKVIAHFHDKLNLTCLEYVSKIYQTENAKAAAGSRPNIRLNLPCGTLDDLLGVSLVGEALSLKPSKKICKKFSERGYCSGFRSGNCSLSHSVTDIIIHKETKKLRRSCAKDEVNDGIKKPKLDSTIADGQDMAILCHRAGVDSLLTGFSFAAFTVLHLKELKNTALHIRDFKTFSGEIPHLPSSLKSEILNKLYLHGQQPLWVTKSHFAKTSSAHEDNIIRIFVGQ